MLCLICSFNKQELLGENKNEHFNEAVTPLAFGVAIVICFCTARVKTLFLWF